MKNILLLFLITLAIGSNGSPLLQRATQPTVVDPSTQVTYVGNSSRGVESFLNIRFGQDTGGINRFKAPQAFSYPNNTVVNASAPGAACPQAEVPLPGIPIFDNVTNISEDCLNLRVDRPANISTNAKLPVMVWVYGGGFNIGQIYDTPYIPALMIAGDAAKQIPIIYVAMNYRVGIFGFASSPAISSDDLNMGLLDQRLALQWVQKNIHLFGGDPDNITLFGESAGAESVGLHIVSYGGNSSMRPVFKRGIMQSGGVTGQFGVTSNKTANHTSAVIDRVNCTSPSGNSSAELSCLRAVPRDTLVSVSTNFALSLGRIGGFNTFAPVVPSKFLPSAPSTLISQGNFHKSVSLISGWCENDGSLFVPHTIRTESDFQTWLDRTSNLTSSAKEQVLDLYPSTDFYDDPSSNTTAQFFRASQIERDGGVCSALLLNAAMASTSTNSTSNYLYTLNSTVFTPFLAKTGQTYLGVPHFSDIAFVFNQAGYPSYMASQAQIALASMISGSWAAFAYNGNVQGSAVNATVQPWTEGATANSSAEYGLRILGGPRAGMARIGGDDSNTGLPSYDEDLIKRCQFWNSPEVLQMNGT